MDECLQDQAHKRFNPLTQSFVLCSPHRAKRPWLGQVEPTVESTSPEYDPNCYLCPRNKRATSGMMNPNYQNTFVFDNDFPAVKMESTKAKAAACVRDQQDALEANLLCYEPVQGICRVVCFSPKHHLTMAEMSVTDIKKVINTWIQEYQRFHDLPKIHYVQIFENKGAMMGCSNPHPHGQIWATQDIPEEPLKEIHSMQQYHAQHDSCLLCDYLKLEKRQDIRIICENESFVCLVPFWAMWPFETMILSKQHMMNLLEFNAQHIQDLGDILSRTNIRYDNLFQCSFPYSMGIHQSPLQTPLDRNSCHFHIHFYPPLLRSSTVKKFIAGFELLGHPQRDMTPEQAAEKLANCSEEHYKTAKAKISMAMQ